MIDANTIAICITVAAVAGTAAYCFLAWLRSSNLSAETAVLTAEIAECRGRLNGLQDTQENRAAAHAQKFSALESELSALKGSITAAVEKVQTTQAATFVQGQMRPPGGRPKMYP